MKFLKKIGKEIGRSTKKVGKEIGRSTKKVGKEIGRGTKKAEKLGKNLGKRAEKKVRNARYEFEAEYLGSEKAKQKLQAYYGGLAAVPALLPQSAPAPAPAPVPAPAAAPQRVELEIKIAHEHPSPEAFVPAANVHRQRQRQRRRATASAQETVEGAAQAQQAQQADFVGHRVGRAMARRITQRITNLVDSGVLPLGAVDAFMRDVPYRAGANPAEPLDYALLEDQFYYGDLSMRSAYELIRTYENAVPVRSRRQTRSKGRKEEKKDPHR